MGLDKEEKIEPKRNILAVIYLFCKKHIPEMVVIIPGILTILTYIIKVFEYFWLKGYYDYFNVADEFMLTSVELNIYRLIIGFTVIIVYLIYTIIVVGSKGNWILKGVYFILIPFIINFYLLSYGLTEWGGILIKVKASFLLIFFHWVLIFCLGYCLDITFQSKLTIKNRKKMLKEKSSKFTTFWNIKKLILIFIILCSIIICISYIYTQRNNYARIQKQFDYIEFNDGSYAILGTDGKRFLIQKCEINKKKSTIILDTDTYKIINCQNVLVNRAIFKKAIRKCDL
ncbi:hypothetical protein [Anaerosacchariphilus polymeriproducens]|uniref:Uncharacterized protein n=1 Tax=Anaerosacchariphilus polymeriproducens TaxID=1812858 RepID=A0A371ARQ5_9FIRM|nr:hypothetical protein [Anaerosacchariphilus polymeriproducens]RDU22222.1 hypothetical protein DWV06_17010 [Anaerosacchariphilus polymeriproducens]